MRKRMICAVGVLAAIAPSATAQICTQVSRGTNGWGGNYESLSSDYCLSSDGRYVVFCSFANGLVPGDTNGVGDVFVRDRLLGTTERVSIGSSGNEGNQYSEPGSISADNRYVAFTSQATNLVPGDTNGVDDMFVRDRVLSLTERVSIDSSGLQSNGDSLIPIISSDGRFVVFRSDASNLVPGDTNGVRDVFVRDRVAGTTERVSVGILGQGNGACDFGGVSADGRFVAFGSEADNLVAGDLNQVSDIFLRDRQLGTTTRISVGPSGEEADGDSGFAMITPDGRYVLFSSHANNLVPNDSNSGFDQDVFVRDLLSGTTERVNVGPNGEQGYGLSVPGSITPDGRYVTIDTPWRFVSDANPYWDVYRRDRVAGTTIRVSTSLFSQQETNGDSCASSISVDGKIVSFTSFATNIGWNNDRNDDSGDVFAFDADPAHFTSFCDPGVGGVKTCPCGNPPSGPGRGCENSSQTGGATLTTTFVPFTPYHSASVSYLHYDSLWLKTSGQRPNTLSLLLQGTGMNPTGLVFGQGVRCVSGLLKRLWARASDSSGSITFPDPTDPSGSAVSWRSAQLGDVIQPSQTRYYLVYYRDGNVLGGCPASSGFNSTQSAAVVWWW